MVNEIILRFLLGYKIAILPANALFVLVHSATMLLKSRSIRQQKR
ncbi:hypothetical protein M23134_03837 [Microscilla marina ATCC 23134]|uniref:Uncharacterized protein n=1 Tax=Microscilla marina ATCC 23134 TaxID=313606 RepID=A1ZPM9_MICM2|nr:hypothetical protein M23134_03837 [Microscilla marina ATCC 23134]